MCKLCLVVTILIVVHKQVSANGIKVGAPVKTVVQILIASQMFVRLVVLVLLLLAHKVQHVQQIFVAILNVMTVKETTVVQVITVVIIIA